MAVLGLAACHSENGLDKVQVRPGDQPGYPKDTIESFVGHSSMGLLCPPAERFKMQSSAIVEQKSSKRKRTGTSYTSVEMVHTHAPPQRGK